MPMGQRGSRIFEPIQNLAADHGTHSCRSDDPPSVAIIQSVAAPLAHRQVNEKRNRIGESLENKMRMKFERACRDEYGKGHGCRASMASYCEMLLLRKLPVRADTPLPPCVSALRRRPVGFYRRWFSHEDPRRGLEEVSEFPDGRSRRR